MKTMLIEMASKSTKIEGPILIIFGAIFILLGIALFGLFPYTKRKGNLYKQKQLDLYKEKHNRLNIKYEDTNMYLPAWEKAKVFSPLFFGMVFIIIGVGFLMTLSF